MVQKTSGIDIPKQMSKPCRSNEIPHEQDTFEKSFHLTSKQTKLSYTKTILFLHHIAINDSQKQVISPNKHNPLPSTFNIPQLASDKISRNSNIVTIHRKKKIIKAILNKSLLLLQSRKPPTLILRKTPIWPGLDILLVPLMRHHEIPTRPTKQFGG